MVVAVEMDERATAIQLAVEFLRRRNIGFEEPVSVHPLAGSSMEVTFMVEGFSNPALVIDPSEIVVRVNLQTKETALVDQM